MGITNWFRSLFNQNNRVDLNCIMGEITASTFYKELALHSSINLISNSISRSTFKTYRKGKEVSAIDHYILNVEANKNTSSSEFWRKVIANIIYKGECLVITRNQRLYIADSFYREEFAFKENEYSEIQICNTEVQGILRESDVMYFTWYSQKLKILIDSLNSDYAKLIEISSKSYKRSKGKKGTLEIPTQYGQTEEQQADLQDLMDNRFKKYFEAEGDALIPLTDGLKYNERGGNEKSSKNTEGGREIKDFINDIFDFVGMALRIPPSLLKGNVADNSKAVNDYLSFCLNPLVKFITDEINRKWYGVKDYQNNTYVKCDTSNIKVVDLKDIANPIDVLTRVGAYSIDDSLKALGMEPLNTEWSKARFMTKNYMPIIDMINGNYEKGEGCDENSNQEQSI